MIRVTIDHEPFSYNGRIRVQDVRDGASGTEYPIPGSKRFFEGAGAIERARAYAEQRATDWRINCQTADVHDKVREDHTV